MNAANDQQGQLGKRTHFNQPIATYEFLVSVLVGVSKMGLTPKQSTGGRVL